MPTQLSPLLIAALLLNNFIVAQHIGLRPIKTIRETIGLSAVTAITLLLATMIDWPLAQYWLQPTGLDYLHPVIVVLLVATIAQISEIVLRKSYAQFFSQYGNHLPLAITNSILLTLALQQRTTHASFIDATARAIVFGCGFSALMILFAALRAKTATANLPQAFRGAAIDMLSAGLILLACSGLAGML